MENNSGVAFSLLFSIVKIWFACTVAMVTSRINIDQISHMEVLKIAVFHVKI